MRALALLWVLSCLAAPAAAATVDAALPDAPPLPPEVRAALVRALAARGPDYTPRTRHLRPDGSPQYTNRLLLESSPYLLQHAHNPVDWRPWGDEAFAEARRLKRPVLVSIGYSTCHWCHVMEEESFEDLEIARLLNANFVAIKVDRESRPDVDAVYMAAAQALGRSGGWPLNVWVTPDRKPFYAGTYFPPRDREGRPGLATVLPRIAAEYAGSPERIEGFAQRVEAAIHDALEGAAPTAPHVPGADTLEAAARQVLERIDWTWGGAGSQPKFPSGVPLRLLLRYHRRSGDPEALRAVSLTLEKMAAGGIHDHLGGGFHRYATDARWLVPHFEKMLYANALLAITYLEAWQATGRDDFAEQSREILDYLQREMQAPEGGFYSATDADSRDPDGEMEEGRFFTWTPAELAQVLGPERARIAAAWFDVSDAGELDGRSVLHTPLEPAQLAAQLDLTPEALAAAQREIRQALYAARQQRPAPLRDEKRLAAWNGLAIAAFARAGLAFSEPAYVATAVRTADFVLGRMRRDGRLQRVFVDGKSGGPAFLEDYAFLIDGLIQLYEAAPDPRWLREALALQAVVDAHYADPKGGAYFATADDQERLLAREKPIRDGALPSGNSVTALNLLRLADLSSDEAHRQRALQLLSAVGDEVRAAPAGFGDLGLALDYLHDTAKEIALVRPPDGGDLDAMLAPLRRSFVPNRVLAVVIQGSDLDAHAAVAPWLAGKRARRGRVTAYVCENHVCALPTDDPAVFAGQIARVKQLE